jgi:endonuclease/exonuclease/phosphatase family metal-dependent hydrolase
LVASVTQVFAKVQATNFPERAAALTAEIAAVDPHLVALQEVSLWRSQTPSDSPSPPNATDVEYDFLGTLRDELAARGKAYEAVATVQNVDAEAPRATSQGLQDIRLTDHNVLLARADLPTKQFAVSHPRTGTFTARLTLANPVLGAIPLLCGWVEADVAVQGRVVHIVTTHLERLQPSVQVAQANELLAGPLQTDLPTILLGDLNSAAGGVGAVPGQSDTDTYATLREAGFSDAAQRSGRPWKPGVTWRGAFTCCQSEDLTNAKSTLSERIDLILTRGGIAAASATVIGGAPRDRTSSGLWPSDHAGLWAALQFSNA